ncbi:MAG: DNA/RNA nuclease SfsA [Halobacteriovoraceae bacterium]|nr:DNA/RNA nuclease SfsA [Halobacteriovoraceae bacterium]|tara:strand:- start:5071 stop:5769 length:699 start_codon:yes stop_codon:yes gene_type:complete
MKFSSPLIRVKIIKRYKRFLSDLELENGEIIHAHVPNTGSMKTCWKEGWHAYISKSNDPKRKLPYTWELTDTGDSLICINTNLPNKIVKEALELKKIEELKEYSQIKPEKKVLDSRIDFYLTEPGKPDAYVEVKNVTLKGDDKRALFPDAVSTRGQKHLRDLIQLKQQGHRAVMLYLINRTDVDFFSPASEIDPEYTKLLKEAHETGVEILPYQTHLSQNEISIHKKIDFEL